MKQVILPPSDEWSKLLSNREFKVALLVARGFSNKKVAHELSLSDGTVKVYLTSIFQKLGAKRRYDLIVELSRNSSIVELSRNSSPTPQQKRRPQVSIPKAMQR